MVSVPLAGIGAQIAEVIFAPNVMSLCTMFCTVVQDVGNDLGLQTSLVFSTSARVERTRQFLHTNQTTPAKNDILTVWGYSRMASGAIWIIGNNINVS